MKGSGTPPLPQEVYTVPPSAIFMCTWRGVAVKQVESFGQQYLLTQSREAFEGEGMKFHLCYREQEMRCWLE